MPWAGRLFHLKNGTPAFVHDATLRKLRCPARTSGHGPDPITSEAPESLYGASYRGGRAGLPARAPGLG
jgi:hypothetical protein